MQQSAGVIGISIDQHHGTLSEREFAKPYDNAVAMQAGVA
jgi:hypothetical protein